MMMMLIIGYVALIMHDNNIASNNNATDVQVENVNVPSGKHT